MPRPVGEAPDDFEPEEVEAIKNGEPVSEYGDQLSKVNLGQVAEDLDYDDFEGRLASEACERLVDWGMEVDPESVSINIASSWEDLSHLQEYDLEIENNAAYISEEDEIVIFGFSVGGRMGTSSSNAYSSTVHEMKHHQQDGKFDEMNPEVSESSTQLINLYLSDELDDQRRREDAIRSLRSGDYDNSEEIAEELRLATEVYDNLVKAGKSQDEAMTFLLNEYEERRWNI